MSAQLDTMPKAIFHRFDCNSCGTKYAVLCDGEKYLYYDAKYIPNMPMFTVIGNPLICPMPQCEGRYMRVVAYGAVLTRDGEWLVVDKVIGVG